MSLEARGGGAAALAHAEIRPLTEPLIELAVRVVHAHTERPHLEGRGQLSEGKKKKKAAK